MPDSHEGPTGIAETISAGSLTLQRWTIACVEDLGQAINESLPELGRFMLWATAHHNCEAITI